MPFSVDTQRTDPKSLKVAVNIQVPWTYRDQLRKLANKRGESMNRLLVNALYSMIPPE